MDKLFFFIIQKVGLSFFVEMLRCTNSVRTFNKCVFLKSFPVNFVPTGCVLVA